MHEYFSRIPVPVAPELRAALEPLCGTDNHVISLPRFIETVLYDPSVGYYRKAMRRVGRDPETDFYTAASLGPLFARMVVAACQSLLGDAIARHTFVEIGPEHRGGLLGFLDPNEPLPFAGHLLIHPGDPIQIPPAAIVFSNEIFDAQPFHRLVWASDHWCCANVQLCPDGLRWHLDPAAHDPDLADVIPQLPTRLPTGYLIDWPSGAHALLGQLLSQPWSGAFIACDYGLDRATIFYERPNGTGRTYRNHRIGADLLADPGNHDITHHLIWQEMERIMADHRFHDIHLQRQESFFMHHAQPVIQSVLSQNAHTFARDKQTLMELLHPGNMGAKFQVLSAHRFLS